MIQAAASENWSGPITVLIYKSDSSEITSQFQFIAQKTQDPKERRESALKHLAELHYQKAKEFDGTMTAVFTLNSDTSKQLKEKESINLKFNYSNQEYILSTRCKLLNKSDPMYQYTYWHNYMFNRTMPGTVDIVAFFPDWEASCCLNPGDT